MRRDRRQLASLKFQLLGLRKSTITMFLGMQQLLPGAVLGVVQQVVALLEFGVHVQHELVAFGTDVDQLLVERVLEPVDSVRVCLHSRLCQTIAGLHRRHLVMSVIDFCYGWPNKTLIIYIYIYIYVYVIYKIYIAPYVICKEIAIHSGPSPYRGFSVSRVFDACISDFVSHIFCIYSLHSRIFDTRLCCYFCTESYTRDTP